MKSMKHIVTICALGAAFALLLTGTVPAFAAWGDNTFLDWDDVSAVNAPDTSPHGNYSTTSQKCGVCHSVHNAQGELLLQSSVTDACTYCHVTNGISNLTVYNGVYANYSGTDFENAHNNAGSYTSLKCTSCHQVHAAFEEMTANQYLTDKILSGSKLDAGYDPNAGAPLVETTDDKPTALSKWCTKCHLLGGRGYYATSYGVGLTTHVMKQPTADYSSEQLASTLDTQVAFQSSEYCSSCHVSNYDDGSGAWPHYTAGARFLISADDSSGAGLAPAGIGEADYDGVCLRCHRSGDGRGVGQSW